MADIRLATKEFVLEHAAGNYDYIVDSTEKLLALNNNNNVSRVLIKEGEYIVTQPIALGKNCRLVQGEGKATIMFNIERKGWGYFDYLLKGAWFSRGDWDWVLPDNARRLTYTRIDGLTIECNLIRLGPASGGESPESWLHRVVGIVRHCSVYNSTIICDGTITSQSTHENENYANRIAGSALYECYNCKDVSIVMPFNQWIEYYGEEPDGSGETDCAFCGANKCELIQGMYISFMQYSYDVGSENTGQYLAGYYPVGFSNCKVIDNSDCTLLFQIANQGYSGYYPEVPENLMKMAGYSGCSQITNCSSLVAVTMTSYVGGHMPPEGDPEDIGEADNGSGGTAPLLYEGRDFVNCSNVVNCVKGRIYGVSTGRSLKLKDCVRAVNNG